MASVRMTNELRHSLNREAMIAWDNVNHPAKPTNEEKDFLHNAYLDSPFVHAINNATATLEALAQFTVDTSVWKTTRSLIGDISRKQESVRFVTGSPSFDRDGERQNYHRLKDASYFEVHFDTPRLFPMWGGSWSSGIHTTDFKADCVEKANEIIDKYHRAREAHNEKRKAFDNKIESLLNNCNTVKQAIEAWPGIEKLLPDSVIQKMHTKQTRKERAAAVRQQVDFDATEANQAILTSNLLGL